MKIKLLLSCLCIAVSYTNGQQSVLKAADFQHYINRFNNDDNELYQQVYPDAVAWSFLKKNIPLFDCPDKALEETYYFRWWTLRKHIRQTPAGYIFTEFLPNVPWAGKYNSISCAAGHHFYEARWLRDPLYLDDYMHFWLNDAGEGIRSYSFWAADAWKAFVSVHTEKKDQPGVLEQLIRNYSAWENTHREPVHGLFWQSDGADGMEVSVGGQLDNNGKQAHGYKGIRPSINSYMYGDARAIAALAGRLGDTTVYNRFNQKADSIKQTVQGLLWSDSLQFFGTIALDKNQSVPDLLPVRELIGYTPWYFNLPDDNPVYTASWKQLMDTAGFMAPFGPTTCERRHPYFTLSYKGHECQWNGPSWPYATAQTLTAMANVLNNYNSGGIITKKDYYSILSIYANSQHRVTEKGKTVAWIDENLNPFTGDWISRTRLADWPGNPWPVDKGGKERGKDYNHSSFNDLIISGLAGIRPSLEDTLTVHPLVPDAWEYFCLDNVPYHGNILTVFYDKTGKKYKRGKGFFILVNGKQQFHSATISKAAINISNEKSEDNRSAM